MAPTARPAAMAKTRTSVRNKSQRGVALLEAVIALALVSLIAGAAYSAFSRTAAATARAEDRLAALAAAESGLELASAPATLITALETGEAVIAGEGWRVIAEPYETDGDAPLALIRLTASAGPEIAPIVTLSTLRAIPK